MSTYQKNAAKKKEENALLLKSRVKDLEGEVQSLKQRLEDLRKAKSNTIVKREREVLQVGQPQMGRTGVETFKYTELEQKLAASEESCRQAKSDAKDLQNKLDERNKNRLNIEKERDEWKFKYEEIQNELATLQRSHALELEKARANLRDKSAMADDYANELDRLRERLEVKAMQEEHKTRENSGRETFINDLMAENVVLREKVESLFLELSVKEAQWLESEEQKTTKLSQQFDEKYARWMQETEKKIEDLRSANLLLKSCLNKGLKHESTSHSSEADGSQPP